MTEDYTQEMKFWFGNRYGDESDLGQVHLERGADYLPNVMEAFERFLRQAGFTYIELLTDGESWQFIKTGGLSDLDDADEPDFCDMTDEEFDRYWAGLDENPYDAEVQQDILDEEAKAYEAERTYDEEYYDPFTRHVDWDFFFGPAKPTIKVGDKVRVTHPDLGDSKYVFGREGTVDTIAEFTADIHAGQIVRVEFQPPGISAGSFETAFWWINPDALEVIG